MTLQNEIEVNGKLFEPFITRQAIQQRTQELAAILNSHYANHNTDKIPVLIPVLTGAYAFAHLLFEYLNFKYSVDFVKISSYGKAMQSSGNPILILKNQLDINQHPVLIIEDIIESGLTTDFLHQNLSLQNPASIEIITLIQKSTTFKATIKPKYVGFEIPDHFIVGFGMDYAEDGRYYKDIYKLKSE